MFGIYRTVLALFVVVGHLFGPGQMGTYAVFGFYVLSGYLMTFIMTNNYGYDLGGRKRFAINRILRIYPPYYVAIIISLILLGIYGDQVTEFKPTIFMPSTLLEYLQNVFLMFPPLTEPRLSPPSWALTVELFYYGCICLGLSKNKRITWIWFLGSILYTLYLLSSSAPWVDRYFAIPAASLPFSMGAMIFHHKERILQTFRKYRVNKPLFWFALMCLHFLVIYSIETITQINLVLTLGFYINLVILSCCMIALLDHKIKYVSPKWDSIIGDYSYPIYLVHYQAGAIVYGLSGNYLDTEFLSLRGLVFLLLSTLLTFLISFLVIQFVDKPIQKIRYRFKTKKI